jgi:predicted amidohydrolase YtcJ
MQPLHAASDQRFALERLGPARLVGAYAWRSLLCRGVTVAFGSDFPVVSARPLDGLSAAVHDRPGERWGERADESLTLAEAVDAYTGQNARASMREGELGVLRPGALADLTVLDSDPHEATDWSGIGVRATLVDGVLR